MEVATLQCSLKNITKLNLWQYKIVIMNKIESLIKKQMYPFP